MDLSTTDSTPAAGTEVDTSRRLAIKRGAALAAGAAVVNDVSGGLADPEMVRVVADAGCPWVLMHWRGQSSRMRELAVYTDVVKEVCAELGARVDAALAGGGHRVDVGAADERHVRAECDRHSDVGTVANAGIDDDRHIGPVHRATRRRRRFLQNGVPFRQVPCQQ